VVLLDYYQVSVEVSKLGLPAFKRRPAIGARFFGFGWKPITKKFETIFKERK